MWWPWSKTNTGPKVQHVQRGWYTHRFFVIKEVLCVTVLPELAGLVYTQQHHCCWPGSNSFGSSGCLEIHFMVLNRPHRLGNAHELMFANTWCHYLASRTNACAILFNSRTQKGWSDIFVSEKGLEEARWVNKFATDDTALQVGPLRRGQLGFLCCRPVWLAQTRLWAADLEQLQTQLLSWSIEPYMDQALTFPPTSENQVTSQVLAVALKV